MALRALLWRTQFELHLSRAAADRLDIESRNAELTSWIKAASIPFSPKERALLDRELGGWSTDEIAEMVWRNEAAAPLLWYLELVPQVPPYFVVVPAAAVMERIEQLPNMTLDMPKTRSREELENALELASLWNWRARCEALRRSGAQAPEGDTYEGVIAQATNSAIDIKLVEKTFVLDGDLLVTADTKYGDVDADQQRTLACIAHERHWALAWIADGSTSWDTVNPAT